MRLHPPGLRPLLVALGRRSGRERDRGAGYAGGVMADVVASFLVARNPEPDSTLPFLLSVPLDDGVLLKARERWPSTTRVYCHPLEHWPADAAILEQVAVRECRRRGAAIDLVLDRSRENRSQIVFTQPSALRRLLKDERVQPGWLLELVARLQVRYPAVPIVFADSRKLAEDWTYRYVAAALVHHPPPEAEPIDASLPHDAAERS